MLDNRGAVGGCDPNGFTNGVFGKGNFFRFLRMNKTAYEPATIGIAGSGRIGKGIFGEYFASLENNFSTKIWKVGMSSDNPKPIITITDKLRSKSAEIPLIFTIVDKKSVKNVKLAIKPVIIPIDLLFPTSTPPTVEDSIIGKIGRIQGDKIVTIPARKANKINSVIYCVLAINSAIAPPFHLTISSPFSSI